MAPPPRVMGPNYRLGSETDGARGREAPGLAVNPTNPQHIVEVDIDLLAQQCRFNVSFDGGRTWTGGRLDVPPGFVPPCRSPAGTAYPAMDQSVAFGAGQNVYTTFSSIRGTEGDSILVARSSDGGRSFGVPTVIIPGGPGGVPGNPFHTRPKLAVDRGAGPGGRDLVYVTAWGLGPPNRIALTVASEDGGLTWAAPVAASAPDESAREQTQPVVGPDSSVYLVYRVAAFRTVGAVVLARSRDRGATWTRTKVRDIGDDPNLELAIDRRNGTLFLSYNETFDGDIDVMIQRSTDGGVGWSEPLRINDDPRGLPVVQQLPHVTVAANGRVDMVWHDRRHAYRGGPFPACPYLQIGPFLCQGDTYYAFSVDGGRSFSPNKRITDRTINLDVGFDRRLETYTSYSPVSVPIGDDAVLFAWADSREGDFDDDNQDIYLARLEHRASGPLPIGRVPEVRAPAFSASVSQLAYPGGLEAVAGRPAP
ncbi:MAG: sialidase family protein, partial [Acidimicrobiales bacterium]